MRKQKYCYLHRTRNHDTSECRDTNNQRNFQNSETKKEKHSAFFIDASKSSEVERIELDAIFDTGSKDNYIGASLIDEEKTRVLSKSKFITVANGQKQEIKREAPIILEFLQIPNATFSFLR